MHENDQLGTVEFAIFMATNHHMAQNHKKKLSKLEKIRDTGIQIQTEDICFFHDCELCSFSVFPLDQTHLDSKPEKSVALPRQTGR